MLAQNDSSTPGLIIRQCRNVQLGVDVESRRALRVDSVVLDEWRKAYGMFTVEIGVHILANVGVEEWVVVFAFVEELNYCFAEMAKVGFCRGWM